MEIKVVRDTFSLRSTTSKCYVDGLHRGFILEDHCRQPDPAVWSPAFKVSGNTAIPYGRYQVVVTFSERFRRPLPLLLGVPDYTGIRIHTGNCDQNTDGCLLPGLDRRPDWVTESHRAFGLLFIEIEAALRKEKVWLTLERDDRP